MSKVRKRKWVNKEGRPAFAWFFDYTEKTGTRIRKSGYKTKVEAEKALAKITNDINTGVYVEENKSITFEQASQRYIDLYVSIYCRESTKEGYEGYLRNHLIPYFGHHKLINITTAQIQQFVKEKLDANLSNQTINHMLILLGCVFNKMIDEEMILKNPVDRVKKLKLTKEEMKILTLEEVHKVLDVAKLHYPDFFPVLFTAIFTGMRQGELLALKWDKINWVSEKIYINETYRQGRISPPKTETSIRCIDMSHSLVKVLKEWRLRCPHRKYDLVFPSSNGNYKDCDHLVKRRFKKVLSKAQVGTIRWHDLRHTYASIMIAKNVAPKYIQNQLGHASIQITMDRYGHLMPEVSQGAKDAIDSLFLDKEEHLKCVLA